MNPWDSDGYSPHCLVYDDTHSDSFNLSSKGSSDHLQSHASDTPTVKARVVDTERNGREPNGSVSIQNNEIHAWPQVTEDAGNSHFSSVAFVSSLSSASAELHSQSSSKFNIATLPKVSWVRHRDIHLLTVGRFTYTSDGRFSARHTPGSEDWLLMIHYLQKRDAGMYGCQISTTPPRSHLIHLSVVEPETVIVGGPDVYINTGSRLSLTCSVKYSPEPPAFIFWYHDDKLVSYDRTRGGVVVSTEKGVVTTSRLLVQFAETRHTGRYTCAPANSTPKSVNVHVIAGDQPAAIVHENNSGSCINTRTRAVSCVFLSILLAPRIFL
nr:uncharacterized protein LOC128699483 [Cherax quadricarinatus]